MPNRILSARLASKAGTRQVEASAKADAAALAADAAIATSWAALLKLLGVVNPRMPYLEILAAALPIFRAAPIRTEAAIDKSLKHIARWGHRTAADNYTETLPLGYLQVAALTPDTSTGIQTGIPVRSGSIPVYPGAPPAPYIPGLPPKPPRPPGLMPPPPPSGGEPPSPYKPGVIELGRSSTGGLTVKDLAAHVRGTNLQDKDAIAKILFPPPTEAKIEAVMNHPRMGIPWRDQLKHATRLATPEQQAAVFAQGVSSGKTQKEIAEDLLPIVNNERVAAKRIARTEGLRIAHAFQEDAASSIDVLIMGKQILALLDIVTRPAHRARNGRVWYKDGNIPMQEALKMDGPTLPDNFNCVLPGTLVQGMAQAASKATYSGQAIELVTATGKRLSVTVNHPILTKNGFVAAGKIKQGDYLASYRASVDSSARKDYQQNAPAVIDEVFASFRILDTSSSTKIRSALDFHGDGQFLQSNIEVVIPDCFLLRQADAHPLKDAGDLDFLRCDPPPLFFMPDGKSSPSRLALRASRCLRRHSAPLDRLRFGLVPNLNAKRFKLAIQRSPANTKFSRQSVERLPALVSFSDRRYVGNNQLPSLALSSEFAANRGEFSFDCSARDSEFSTNRLAGFAASILRCQDLVGREIEVFPCSQALGPATELDTCLPKDSHDGLHAGAILLRELSERFPCNVSLDQVVAVNRSHYSGPVFDMQTTTGYFVASSPECQTDGGIIIKNCRCHFGDLLRPPSWVKDQGKMEVFRGAADRLSPDNSVYADWFGGADERLQRIAVGTRRYSAVRDMVGKDTMQYEHFIDLEGNLLPVTHLQSESPDDRAARVAFLMGQSSQRRKLVRDLATFGFLP